MYFYGEASAWWHPGWNSTDTLLNLSVICIFISVAECCCLLILLLSGKQAFVSHHVFEFSYLTLVYCRVGLDWTTSIIFINFTALLLLHWINGYWGLPTSHELWIKPWWLGSFAFFDVTDSSSHHKFLAFNCHFVFNCHLLNSIFKSVFL